jgi:hypothetical protein
MKKGMTTHLHATRAAIRTTTVLALSLFIIASGIPSVKAHNIDVVAAREKAREYARQKVADPNRAYEHYSTDCLAAFPGHNHYVRCSIFYQDENRRQLCKERIEVYLAAHHNAGGLDLGRVTDLRMYVKHTSAKEC